MKLYLSSFRIGDRPEVLAGLFAGRKRVGVIRNALDFSDDQERLEAGRVCEFADLQSLGLEPEGIDLRHYFGRESELAAKIGTLDGLWVVGGNTFILRRAMRQSGLDNIMRGKVADADFVYAGYSAGACVVTPTLRGIHLADEPDVVPEGYEPEILWDGLGLVPFSIAPHYRSDHPESALIEKSVEFMMAHKIPYMALRDGEVYVGEV